MSTNWQRIYTDLGALIAQEPEELAKTYRPSRDGLMWLGRVQAVVGATGSAGDTVQVRNAVMSLQNQVLLLISTQS